MRQPDSAQVPVAEPAAAGPSAAGIHSAPPESPDEAGYVQMSGRRFYRIPGYDSMAPFFMTVVGSGDAWLFASSTGGLTAGRVDAESALFPYYTDDKVAESAGRTGGLSLLRVFNPTGPAHVWEPFSPNLTVSEPAQRCLYKDIPGTTLVFEEVRADLGLRLRVSWQASNTFGIVRGCELTNIGPARTELALVDGLVNVLPAAVGTQAQNRLSNLLDAYKRSEVDPQTGLGVFWLSSRLTDLAEPSESLTANVAWQVGLGAVDHLLSTTQIPAFLRGVDPTPEHDVRGQRGAYLIHTNLSLEPGQSTSWQIAADVDQDAAAVVGLRELLTAPIELAGHLAADLAQSRQGLERILAAADGLQTSGDELACAHHLANVLFNVMRGGIPADGYQVSAGDVRAFIAERSPATAQRCRELLDELPDRLSAQQLVELAHASKDPDLRRLALEYLPLTFSRRHGDPSRPWNKFTIALRDSNGNPRLSYEGNWRDIFQNWEALAWSFPEYLESMVAVFVDATTADGYNPYRISRSGVDWEVPEPDNPFANIGYWSDHQIIYLLKLLETSASFHPGRLAQLLDQQIFTHADVPYRIASLAETLADPYNTITFDVELQAAIQERAAQRGGDGRLLHTPDGDLVRVTLAEKLLLLLLAKLVNFVPDGGIWMNTQRPEWNDANNALVGRGLSVVTLAQLRRYVAFLGELLTDDVAVTAELGALLREVAAALQAHEKSLKTVFTATSRMEFMTDLGTIGSAYRQGIYANGFSGEQVSIPASEVHGLLGRARDYIDATLKSNVRPDSLIHSYNLLHLSGDGAAIQRLPEMLEGQVAILASGELTAPQALELLAGLRASKLYRPDQHSYILYPDKDLPGFLHRNRFPARRADACPLIGALLEAGDRSLITRDVHSDLHFAAGIRNARDVQAALDRLATHLDLGPLVPDSRAELLAIFEEVFDHASFTGRSGSFFAYEGLGSIYWHMVSKLLLAVQETHERAVADGEPDQVVAALAAAYEDVRAGLGYCKPASQYGAFPTDPYSHTPAGAGAKQPGMTGQVKEEVLTRLGELGLRVRQGRIVVRPDLLRNSEWLDSPTHFDMLDVHGTARRLDLPAGSLAFTFCQVPVVYHRADSLQVQVHLADGSVVDCPEGRIDVQLSSSVFARTGLVDRIEVWTPAALA